MLHDDKSFTEEGWGVRGVKVYVQGNGGWGRGGVCVCGGGSFVETFTYFYSTIITVKFPATDLVTT